MAYSNTSRKKLTLSTRIFIKVIYEFNTEPKGEPNNWILWISMEILRHHFSLNLKNCSLVVLLISHLILWYFIWACLCLDLAPEHFPFSFCCNPNFVKVFLQRKWHFAFSVPCWLSLLGSNKLYPDSFNFKN